MKFFVYTLHPGKDGEVLRARFASSDKVNAQPMREVLSMMTISGGVMRLALPLRTSEDAQVFTVRRHVITDDLHYAQVLTKKSVEDFNAKVPDPFSKAELEKLRVRVDEAKTMEDLFSVFGGLTK